MQFSAIQGYYTTKQRLIRMAQTGHVPHAQLWSGPVGSANLPLALAFVTYLNCQHPQPDDSCGRCAACTQIHKLVHPDVRFIFPVASTKQVPAKEAISANFMASWRTFLRTHPYGTVGDWGDFLGVKNKTLSIAKEEVKHILQYVSLKAFGGAYQVLLLWLPEYLHPTAANALLKVLEEPPSRTLFLLISNQPDRVLGTIRSRAQQISIPAFTDDALAASLAQHHQLAPEKLSSTVMLSAGNLNKALQLASDVQPSYLAQVKTWMRLCYARDFTQLVAQAESFQQAQRAYQKDFLAYALQILREAMVVHWAQTGLCRTTQAEQTFTQKFGQTLTRAQIQDFYTWLNQATYHIERNANPKILYLDLSLKIARAFREAAVKGA